MSINSFGQVIAVELCGVLIGPGTAPAQQTPQTAAQAPQRYKLTILQGASTSKRVKKGTASSQAVVLLTDSNNIPVPGVTVTFLLPEGGGGGASFATGGLTSVVTTNSAGIATSGSISSTAGSTLSVGVSAAAPGGAVTATATIATAAAATAAVSTGLIVAIAAVAVGGAVVAAKVASGGGNKPTLPPTPTGTIGTPGTITFGH